MLKYNPQLKTRARKLRNKLTDAEQRLWNRLRGKQILGIQFYRQRPIGSYIVDFYAPAVRLVIEVDGGHHLDTFHARYDRRRNAHLKPLALIGFRFDDRQVLLVIEFVVRRNYDTI